MFSPFLDLKNMSEDELLKKITQLSQRMSYAQSFVGDRSMVNSLGSLLEAFQNEYQERLDIRMHEQWNNQFPAVIESDPDFKPVSPTVKTPAGTEIRPAFNRKFVRPDLDITPVPTRHAETDQPSDEKKDK